MHFCAANCFTLTLENGRYVRADGSDETWTIESFTRGSVTLRRHDAPADWNGFSRDVPYKGQVSNEGNRLVNITVNGNRADANMRLAWGTALNTVPGSNAERDRTQGSQQPQQVVVVRPGPVCFPWFFTLICE
jgi:hypothetical protein